MIPQNTIWRQPNIDNYYITMVAIKKLDVPIVAVTSIGNDIVNIFEMSANGKRTKTLVTVNRDEIIVGKDLHHVTLDQLDTE